MLSIFIEDVFKVDNLVGGDLLRESGRHTGPDDERGVGEVGCAIVERADVVVLDQQAGPDATDLLRALARPGAALVVGAEHLSADTVRGRHRHASGAAWCSPTLDTEIPPLASGRAWRLDLRSPCAFHPDRLLDDIEGLGAGSHRSRGCFWVPTRPGTVQEWSGSGGQLSIGMWQPRGGRAPATHLLLTGVGVPPVHLEHAFRDLLVRPDEVTLDWRVAADGLEPWLGDIDRAA